jgi:succinyl-CoA synthetase alpha subunit
MSILIDRSKRVLIQGITGREGQARTRLMSEYGTQVVAGVTPGKGGASVDKIPVYDTVEEAFETHGGIDISVLFIPAPFVREAALEAISAGVKLLVIVPDRVPIFDVLDIAQAAKDNGARFIGPNTLGVLSPGKAVVGMIGGRAESARAWFKPGPVGICSRSGGITSSMAYYLAEVGIGATTLVHVGGDVVVGLPHPEVVQLFEDDPETKAIVMFGEIGGTQEERVAELVKQGKVTKPIIAFIGGKAAKSGTRFSHAGAIVEGGRGSHEGKVKNLREVGVTVVDAFGELPIRTKEVLQKHGIKL